MKYGERKKIEKVIQRIESGSFDANDVDNLFTKLREYAPINSTFREVGHYLAHNQKRNQGLTKVELNSFWLTVRFMYEYKEKKRIIPIYNLPLWIKDLMIYQTDRLDAYKIRTNLGMSAQRVKELVKTRFKDNKKDNTTKYRKSNLSEKDRKIFDYLLSITIKEAFTTEQVFNDLIEILNNKNFVYDESSLVKQKDKITLCIIHIIDNTVFILDDKTEAQCNLSSETKNNIEGNYLCVQGSVRPGWQGKDVAIAFTLFSTTLKVEEWVHPSVLKFQTRKIDNVNIDFWKDLYINSDFQLVRDGI